MHSKCSAVLRMFDKADEPKRPVGGTALSPGQPRLPRIWPQPLAGRASQVALMVKSPPANTEDRCKRLRFSLWVSTIPRRRKWQPAPVFFPGKSRNTEEAGRLQSMGSQSRARLSDPARHWLAALWGSRVFGSSAFIVTASGFDPRVPPRCQEPKRLMFVATTVASTQMWDTHHRQDLR